MIDISNMNESQLIMMSKRGQTTLHTKESIYAMILSYKSPKNANKLIVTISRLMVAWGQGENGWQVRMSEDAKVPRKTPGKMDTFIILVVVIVSQMYTCVKTHHRIKYFEYIYLTLIIYHRSWKQKNLIKCYIIWYKP